MQKKSFTYKEANKAILYFLGVIIMIGSNHVLVRGPSTWRIDNRQGDLNFTCHYTDAAPLIFNIPNCRKNNTSIVTDKIRNLSVAIEKILPYWVFLFFLTIAPQLKIKYLSIKLEIKYF